MWTRPLLVLCVAAVAACVVVQKPEKEQQSAGNEPRVAQLNFPEEHVRLQHVHLPQLHHHHQHQLPAYQVIPTGGAGGHETSVGQHQHQHPQQEGGVAYQYVQLVPVGPPPPAPVAEKPEVYHPPPVHRTPHPHPAPKYETQFLPSHGLAHETTGAGLIGAGSPHVHFPEEPDHHHHHHHPHGLVPNREQNLKRVLVPLAGIALLGAAAALATNPILLQLGVVSDVWRFAGRRRRREATAFDLKDISALEDLGPGADEVSPFSETDGSSTRLQEIAVLQKFLKDQEQRPQRSHGNGDALLAALLSCSGLADPKNLGCLQRIACEAYDPATDLPDLEMQVLRIVVRQMASHPAIPKELSKKVRLAVATGRKGKCELTYRCPQKAWDQCVNPKY